MRWWAGLARVALRFLRIDMDEKLAARRWRKGPGAPLSRADIERLTADRDAGLIPRRRMERQ